MGDFDGVDPRRVERLRDGGHLLEAVLVPDGVHAVAQGDVADVELVVMLGSSGNFGGGEAMRSAVALAADVMMSRFPAYAGR